MTANAIEREIFIRAGIDHVWSLVSKAGFWIGDELRFDTDAAEGETATIDTEKYGSFPVQVDRLEAPRYAAYRWASAFPGAPPTSDNSTLVEFSLVEQDGGVVVRVKESGFASLSGGSEARAVAYDNNVAGWDQQFARLVRIAERVLAT
jgi:uncharacterized protein YndB with AHSA1/START domain